MASTDVTKEEKLRLVATRIRGVKIDKFNAELMLIEQQALETPDAAVVSDANKIVANTTAQISALETLYTSIESE